MADNVRVTVNGQEVVVPPGTSVAAAVQRAGHSAFRHSVTGEPRGPVCGMGICYECRVTVNGVANQRSCLLPCEPGMEIDDVAQALSLPSRDSFRLLCSVGPDKQESTRVSTRHAGVRAPHREIQPRTQCDLLIVGAGPAGLAAASEASRHLDRVVVLDDNPSPGGQIWRGGSREGATYIEAASAEILSGASVIGAPDPGAVARGANTRRARNQNSGNYSWPPARASDFCRSRGWTLPTVLGAGGLQAMVRSGFPVAGRKVVVAGSGPLLLAVAAHLREDGARVSMIAEQTPKTRLARFGASLVPNPAKLSQAVALRWALRGTRYVNGCWPVKATESSVWLRTGNRTWEEPCDLLACGFGLVPNLELPWLLGCATKSGFVKVDEWQRTNLPDVYAAGEITGIGGVDLAITEGRIAGLAAAECRDEARALIRARARGRRFQAALEQAFALRRELRELASDDTVVCRCEDVRAGQLRGHNSWRAAKLHTRCGMGPCQGRVCGAATDFLYGWGPAASRPPIFASRVESLTGVSEETVT